MSGIMCHSFLYLHCEHRDNFAFILTFTLTFTVTLTFTSTSTVLRCRSVSTVLTTHIHTISFYYPNPSFLAYPATGRGGPMGSRQVKAPDHLDVRHYKGGRSSAISTDRLYPRRNPWCSFLEAESTSGHMVLSEGTTEKIPSDTTGNPSWDRPTLSAAP